MTFPPRHVDSVETFHGTPGGSFGVTLVDGHIQSVTLPLSAMDPTRAADLGATLVNLINEALDKHTVDLLGEAQPTQAPIAPDIAAVERFIARALSSAEATVKASPSLRLELEAAMAQPSEAEILGYSPSGEVQAALVLGQLRRIDINEHFLGTSRPAGVAESVIAAVHDALSHNVVDQRFIDDLDPGQLSLETHELHRRIAALEGERR